MFERDALLYPLGEELYSRFLREGIEVSITGSHNRGTFIRGKTRAERFLRAKRTLVVGVRRSKKLETCRPSAHYQLPLATGCPGMCEYCYLFTNLGRTPYIRIYVNQEEILKLAEEEIARRLPQVTLFEGAATSDPLAVERYSGALAQAIAFFAGQPHGRFRFVTKFTEVEPLLRIRHRGATRFRFSINAPAVISRYEHATPPLAERLKAALKVAEAGYPLGFMIAPIIAEENWKEAYTALFREMAPFREVTGLTFELIAHRFTPKAKTNILELFPRTKLPLKEEERVFKWGQFGYGKYVYPKELYAQIEEFFHMMIEKNFPEATIEYLV